MSYTVKFDNKEKSYPSVTNITGLIDKSQALTMWAVQCMQDYILEGLKELADCKVFEEGEFYKKDVRTDKVGELVKKARLEFRNVSKTAMDIGSAVHSKVEHYIKNKISGQYYNPSFSRVEEERAFGAFLKWERSREIEWLEFERPVFYDDGDVGYGGTLDIIAAIDGYGYIIDLKASRAIYSDYLKQVVAYKIARLFCNGKEASYVRRNETLNKQSYPIIDIERVAILRVDKLTGEPEFKEYTEEQQQRAWIAFYRLLQFYYADKKRRLKGNDYSLKIMEGINYE